MAVTVLGYASADRSVAVDALPAPNSTAVVRARLSRPWPRIGGCAPPIAQRLGQAGVGASCLTWLAPDDRGLAMRAALEASGVDVGGVVMAGTRTAETYLVYAADGPSFCFFDPGDAHRDGLDPAQATLIAGADLVCLAVAPAAATAAALDAVRPGAPVLWSVKADLDAYPSALVGRLLDRADVIALAEGERPFLEQQAPGALAAVEAVVVETRGAAGVDWWHRGSSGHAAVMPVAATDTTGAGDAFVAGMLRALARGPVGPADAVAAGLSESRALLAERAAGEQAA